MSPPALTDLDRLTPREREILQLIGRHHLTSKGVAGAIAISPKRVDQLCESATRKLDVGSRRDAVRLVMRDLETREKTPGKRSEFPTTPQSEQGLTSSPRRPVSKILTLLEKNRDLPRPAHMLHDELMSGLTWECLEGVWMGLASESNKALVPEFVTALWKESLFLPQDHTLAWVLTATILLAGPPCFPASSEAPMS